MRIACNLLYDFLNNSPDRISISGGSLLRHRCIPAPPSRKAELKSDPQGNATRIALDNYHTQLTSLSPSLDLSAPLPPGTSLTPVLNTAAASSGNGSLMRLAPVPAFFHRSFDEAMDATDVQGRTTHASAWCVEACRAACVVLLGLLEETGGAGETCEERKKRVLGAGFVPAGADPADERLVYTKREVQSIVEGSYKTKKVDGIKTTGFVIHSLEAALWALWNSNSFEEVCFPSLTTSLQLIQIPNTGNASSPPPRQRRRHGLCNIRSVRGRAVRIGGHSATVGRRFAKTGHIEQRVRSACREGAGTL